MGWWGWRERKWNVRLTRDIPLKLRFQVGACESTLDLGEGRVTEFSLESGAADTIVRFPRKAGMTRARIKAGSGFGQDQRAGRGGRAHHFDRGNWLIRRGHAAFSAFRL